MPSCAVTEARLRDAGVWLLLALPLLLPFGSAAELPLLLAALGGLALALRGRLDWRAPAPWLALGLFAAYWLPELASAPDSVAPRKSWTEVAADLRFLPFLWFALWTLDDAVRARRLLFALAVLLGLWCLDALLQAATGWSLGGASRGDRLSGIFGDDNLKLGGVVAALAPIAVAEAWRQGGARAALGSFALLLPVVLLAGARAAWIVLAVGMALLLWQRLGPRRGALALGLALLLGGAAGMLAYVGSERFAQRVERTAAALGGSEHELDYALAWRLPIWRTAAAMGAAHPLNGVGVRAFRYAYPQFAAPDDRWVEPDRRQGALHAHHWLLEVFSETGAFGLLCWFAGLGLAWRAWRRAAPAARARAAPVACALAAILFPFNTHYAVYSAFWSLLLFLLWALFLALLHARDAAPAQS
jgi:O-antigen ligase